VGRGSRDTVIIVAEDGGHQDFSFQFPCMAAPLIHFSGAMMLH